MPDKDIYLVRKISLRKPSGPTTEYEVNAVIQGDTSGMIASNITAYPEHLKLIHELYPQAPLASDDWKEWTPDKVNIPFVMEDNRRVVCEVQDDSGEWRNVHWLRHRHFEGDEAGLEDSLTKDLSEVKNVQSDASSITDDGVELPQDLILRHEKQTIKLSVTPRTDGNLTGEQIHDLMVSTVLNWIRAYAAIHDESYIVDEKHNESACVKMGIPPRSRSKPWVTVFAFGHPGLVMHSKTTPQNAVDLWAASYAAHDVLRQYNDKLKGAYGISIVGDNPFAPNKQDTNPQPQQRQQQGADSFENAPQVGSGGEKPYGVSNLRSIQINPANNQPVLQKSRGAADSLGWATSLKRDAYDESWDKFLIAAPINRIIAKDMSKGQLVEFKTSVGDITFWNNDNSEHNYDWENAVKDVEKLGYQLPGSWSIDVKQEIGLVLQVNKANNGKMYLNYWCLAQLPD